MAILLAGCEPDLQGCASITGVAVWDTPPDGPLCVLDDLVVEGRTPAELGVRERVEEVAGSLLIHDNPSLQELPTWPALVRIGGSLSVSANAELSAVHGFPVLAELGGGLHIAENPRLAILALGNALTVVDSKNEVVSRRRRGFR